MQLIAIIYSIAMQPTHISFMKPTLDIEKQVGERAWSTPMTTPLFGLKWTQTTTKITTENIAMIFMRLE